MAYWRINKFEQKYPSYFSGSPATGASINTPA
jgi:hypothetical protein